MIKNLEMNGENKYQVYSYDYSDAQGQQGS